MEIYISDKYKIKDKSEYDLSIIELKVLPIIL